MSFGSAREGHFSWGSVYGRAPSGRPSSLIMAGLGLTLLGLAGLLLPLLTTGAGAEPPAVSDPVLGTAGRPALLVWASGGLPEGLAGTARELPGVAAVAEVRTGIRWLTAWAVAGSSAPLTPPAGFSFPLEIAAVDPDQYEAFLPPGEVAAFKSLRNGSALMGTTAAGLRGIADQGALAFGDVLLPVAGVVADELVRSHEVVVSTDAGARLALVAPSYMLVGLTQGASAERVEGELRKLAPPEANMRVRSVDQGTVPRESGRVLPQAQLKKLFGEFPARPGPGGTIRIDQRWVDEHTVEAPIPLLGLARCHRAIVPQLQGAFSEIVSRGLQDSVYGRDFGGCFSPRFLNRNPNAGISHHAWGVAFDINVSQNLFGEEPALDSRVVEVLERWGFSWGGHWTVPDGMHFEYLRAPELRQ